MFLFFSNYCLVICCFIFFSINLISQTINPNGYNIFYYENGAKSSEGTMRDGKADGYWKNYYKIQRLFLFINE